MIKKGECSILFGAKNLDIEEHSLEKITTTFNGITRIFKSYCIGPVLNPDINDYYNFDINNIIEMEENKLDEGSKIKFSNGEEAICKLYDSIDINKMGLRLRDIEIKDNQRIFFISNLRCSEDNKVIMRLGKYSRIKVWINNLLVFNGYIQRADSYLIHFELKKGNNIIFVECAEHLQTEESAISLRINNVESELKSLEGEMIKDLLDNHVFNNFALLQQRLIISEKDNFEFMVIPRDFINIDLKDEIYITINDYLGKELIKFETKFYEKVSCKISDYLKDIKSYQNNIFTLNISYKTLYGDVVTDNSWFLFGDPEKLLKRYKDRFDEIRMYRKNVNEEDILYINGMLDYLSSELKEINKIKVEANYMVEVKADQIKSPRVIEMEINNLIKAIDLIDKGLSTNKIFSNYGVHRHFYISKLDKSMQNMIIYLPPKYDKNKKYPMIVFLPTYQLYEIPILYKNVFNNKIDDEVIIACVLFRGVNLGSYVGEAAILEGINLLNNKFNIDNNRIYLHGYSNGASATWAISQSHPDIFAAIAILDGVPYRNNLKNYTNMSVLNIAGTKSDLLNESFNLPNKALGMYNSYYPLQCEDVEHSSVANYILNNFIIKWLLQVSKTKYPKHFYLRSERMRHSSFEFIHVLEMGNKGNYFEISGNIISETEIEVDLFNVRKISFEFPKNIATSQLKITINGKLCNVNKELNCNNLIVNIFDENIELNFNSKNEVINKWLGMGILDIYLEPLTIIIPSYYANKELENEINHIANVLSSPKTQGHNDKLYVNYSIIQENKLDKITRNKGNMIIIGCRDNISFLKSFIPHSDMEFDETGFKYKDFEHKGDFCFLYISNTIENPSERNLILYFSSIKIMKKFIFFRKFIISSYSNGIHPYLNNQILIFTGDNYHSIYKNSDSLVTI